MLPDGEAPSRSPVGLSAVVERAAGGAVAILRINGRPLAGGVAQRSALMKLIGRLGRSRDVRAIVLTGAGLFDHDGFAAHEDLDALLGLVASSPAPIVAAIAGDATGAGLELALACAGRVCAPTSTFAWRGVAAARLPRAATLVHLARRAGMEAAADLVAFGRPLSAAGAAGVGLIDRVCCGDLAEAAGPWALTEGTARGLAPLALNVEAEVFGLRLKLRRHAPGQVAPLAAVRALEAAAALPERRLVAEIDRISSELARSEQGIALHYAAAGEAALEALGEDAPALATRLNWSLAREAIHLIDAGATPAQVDRRLEAYGFAEGPFARSDRLGMARVFAVTEGAPPGDDAWISYSPTIDLMADAQRPGGPGAAGWYRRAGDGSQVRFDPEVDELVRASALGQRLNRTPIADEVVVERCLRAAIEATAGHETADLCAAVLDAVWVRHLGFPRWRGGPLWQAQQMGLRTRAAPSRGRGLRPAATTSTA